MYKLLLFLLFAGLTISGCSHPDEPVDASSAEYVSTEVKLEAQTITDDGGIKLNIVITNISGFYVFPNPNFQNDGLPTLMFSVYYWGEIYSQFADYTFENRFWDYGLPPGKSYEADYYISRSDLPYDAEYGDIVIRLSVQTSNGVGVPFELTVPYAFVDRYRY